MGSEILIWKKLVTVLYHFEIDPRHFKFNNLRQRFILSINCILAIHISEDNTDKQTKLKHYDLENIFFLVVNTFGFSTMNVHHLVWTSFFSCKMVFTNNL